MTTRQDTGAEPVATSEVAKGEAVSTGKPMAMGQAQKLADELWTREGTAFTETLGLVKRNKTSPRFMVGMAFLDGTAAVTLGTSDVDWESAFASFAVTDKKARQNVVDAATALGLSL